MDITAQESLVESVAEASRSCWSRQEPRDQCCLRAQELPLVLPWIYQYYVALQLLVLNFKVASRRDRPHHRTHNSELHK